MMIPNVTNTKTYQPFAVETPGPSRGCVRYRVTRTWSDGLVESCVFPHSGAGVVPR